MQRLKELECGYANDGLQMSLKELLRKIFSGFSERNESESPEIENVQKHI